MRKSRFLVYLILVAFIFFGLNLSRAESAEEADEARLLFLNLCSRLGSVKTDLITDPVKHAIWEDTIHYLSKRFGQGFSEGIPLSHAESTPKKKVVWTITTLQGRHKREIKVIWIPWDRKLKILISGDASGRKLGTAKVPIGKYELAIGVDVIETSGIGEKKVLRPAVSNEALSKPGNLVIKTISKEEKPLIAEIKKERRTVKVSRKKIKSSYLVRSLFRQYCSQIRDQKLEIKDKAHRAIWKINSQYLSSFRTGETEGIKIPATAELEGIPKWGTISIQGKHKRKIDVSWDRKKGKLYIDIEGNASGKKVKDEDVELNEYRESIEVDVAEEKDSEGNTKLALKEIKNEKKTKKDILTVKLNRIGSNSETDVFYEPREGYSSSIKVFARECDKNGFLTAINQIDVNGRWIGENALNPGSGGGVWTISHTPLKCENPQASVVLTYINQSGYKKVFKGEIRNWKIVAKYIIRSPEDMDIPKPIEVRRKLAAQKKYDYTVELALRRDKDGGIFLDGKWKGLLVRYSRNLFGDYDIEWVGPGYEEPLQLTRDNSQGNYKITKIRIDTSGWKKKLSTLRSKISKLEDELKRKRDELSFCKSKLNHALKEFGKAKEALERKAKELSRIEMRLNKINRRLLAERLTPENMSRSLKALLERLEEAEIELEVVSDKERKESLKREIFALNKSIQEKYQEIKFDPIEERARLKSEAKLLDEKWEKVMSEYWSIKIKKFDSNEFHVKFWEKNYEDTLNKINEIESKLADLRPKLQMLDQRNTPFVSRVTISTKSGEHEAQWINWGPFKGLELIDKEIERYQRLLKESKRELERAKRNHEKAFEEAQDALYGVTKAIMRSAYFQAAVESGYYFYDVFGKGWSKGGPFGALTEALGKAADSLIFNQGGIKFEEVSDKEVVALEEEAAREQGFDLGKAKEGSKTNHEKQKSNLRSTQEASGSGIIRKIPLASLSSIAAKRIVKDTVFKYGKTQTNKYLMAQVTSYLANHAENKLINGVRKKLAEETLWQMSKRCVKLNNYVDNLLSEKVNVDLNKVANGIARDLLKSGLKKVAKLVEKQAWIDYFKKDIKARIAFRARIKASRAYWKAYDEYMMWKKLKELLAENYDPESNFQGPGPYYLEEGKTYIVKLDLKNPKGRRERVFIDGLEAKPVGALDNHVFEFVAGGFDGETGKDLAMKINFLE